VCLQKPRVARNVNFQNSSAHEIATCWEKYFRRLSYLLFKRAAKCSRERTLQSCVIALLHRSVQVSATLQLFLAMYRATFLTWPLHCAQREVRYMGNGAAVAAVLWEREWRIVTKGLLQRMRTPRSLSLLLGTTTSTAHSAESGQV
jgi:hypothetical protein